MALTRSEIARQREAVKTAARTRARQSEYQRLWSNEHRELVSKVEKRSKLKLRYGITFIEFAQMLVEQEGCCALCGNSMQMSGVRSGVHVDHDHKTGRVRALLCARCNLLVGRLECQPELVEKAFAYLERFRVTHEVDRKVEAV